MSDARTVSGALRDPGVFLATAGWGLTGALLIQSDPAFALATLLLGLLAWILEAHLVAYAVTQVGIAIAAPEPAIATVALLQAGPTVLLLAIVTEQGLSMRTLLSAVTVALLFGTMAIGGYVYGGSVLAAAGTLLTTAAVSSYAIHRYELVSLGLVSGENT